MKRASILAMLALSLAGTAWAEDAIDSASNDGAVARGEYLVHAMGCTDCHTPWKMGPNGPEPDQERYLSGHPEYLEMPAAPVIGQGPWAFVAAGTMTSWSGPWGVSFTANLTPDDETGLGTWTEEEFVATMRSGRHKGMGRPLLPPMPYPNVGGLNDDDIHAVFSYLQSIKPIKNKVPTPIPPAGGAPEAMPASK